MAQQADTDGPSTGASPRRRPVWAAGLFAVYGVGLAAGVLMPQPVPVPADFDDRSVFGMAWLADAILNVALFAPLGVGLRISGLRWRSIALVGLLVSGSIEIVQLVIPGRFASPLDVASNALGAWVGGALPWTVGWLRGEARDRPARLAAGLAAGAAAILLLTSALAAPSLPDSRYYGAWMPDYGGLEQYAGEVVHADVGGVSIPPFGPVTENEALRGALAATALIALDFRVGARPSALAPVLSIVDDAQREILLIGVEGDALVYHLRSRAAFVGLHSPMAVLPGALSGRGPGETCSLRVERDGRESRMRIGDGAPLSVDLGIARGWAFLVWPGSVPHPLDLALDALWLALLLGPIAWLAARQPLGWIWLTGLVSLLAALPVVGPVAALSGLHWGWVGGVVIGAALASRAAQARAQRLPASASR